jgi:hypothetical protein
VESLNNGSCLAAYEGEGHTALGNFNIDAISWMVRFIEDPSVFPTHCE